MGEVIYQLRALMYAKSYTYAHEIIDAQDQIAESSKPIHQEVVLCTESERVWKEQQDITVGVGSFRTRNICLYTSNLGEFGPGIG